MPPHKLILYDFQKSIIRPFNYSSVLIFAKVSNDKIDKFNRLLSIIHTTLSHLRNLSGRSLLSPHLTLHLFLWFLLPQTWLAILPPWNVGNCKVLSWILSHYLSWTSHLIHSFTSDLPWDIVTKHLYCLYLCHAMVYNRMKNLHFNITPSRLQCISLVFWLKPLALILRYVKFHLQLYTVSLKIYFSSPYLSFKL